MAFRADESARNGFESVKNYLIYRDMEQCEKERSEEKLLEIEKKYGPVVDGYPSWHPLVSNHDDRNPASTPSDQCGYNGLDHTRYFRHAFITCPYVNTQKVIDSVDALPCHPMATIRAEVLDVKLYQPNAKPILVYCDWEKSLQINGMIPASIALPLMLEKEVPCWRWSQFGETWETMRSHFLGSPHGSRSSHFVNQETALTMKKVWNLLVNTGMYGPIKVSNQSKV